MSHLYILILTGYFNSLSEDILDIPYLEVLSSHETYEACDEKIVATHDYYLAKDIRRKSSKQRKPRFLYDNNKNKVLYFKNKGINYYASCKKTYFNK